MPPYLNPSNEETSLIRTVPYQPPTAFTLAHLTLLLLSVQIGEGCVLLFTLYLAHPLLQNVVVTYAGMLFGDYIFDAYNFVGINVRSVDCLLQGSALCDFTSEKAII